MAGTLIAGAGPAAAPAVRRRAEPPPISRTFLQGVNRVELRV